MTQEIRETEKMSPLSEGFIVIAKQNTGENMNKKTIAIIVIVTILLIGIGTLSAGLINYYGKIIGTVTILPPETEDDCKDESWKNLVTLNGRQFKNQGDCVSYIQTSMCEDFELLKGYLENFDSYGSCVSFFASKGKSDENLIPVVLNGVFSSVPYETNNTTNGDTNSTETNNTTNGETNSTETGGAK